MKFTKEMKLTDLPKKYRLSYQYSEFLYNNLVATYNSCLKNKIFDTRIKFANEKDLKVFSKLKNYDTIDWLSNNGYYSHHFFIIYKLILRALLFDIITFISESLQNILKGNNVVAYTLLRKPFKDSLTVLEKIYSDPISFYRGFVNNDSSFFDPNKISKPKENMIELIKNVKTKAKMHDFLIPELIYILRFDKQNDNSFDGFWTRAIHLITNAKGIETEKMNFNFIFSGNDERNYQNGQIFYSLPILLYYMNDLVEAMLKLITSLKYDDGYETRRLFGFNLWVQDVHLSKSSIKKVRKILMKNNFSCPSCNKKIFISKQFMFDYCFYYSIDCKKCGKEFDLTKT